MARLFKCSYPGCENVYISGCKTSFFAFPKEPARCQKWIRFCGLEHRYRVARDVGNIKLCINHFNKGDYYHTGMKTRLKKSAIPTIHCNSAVIVQTPQQGHPASLSHITLSPFSNPEQQHKILRTYARKTRVGNSVNVTCLEGERVEEVPTVSPPFSSLSALLPDSLRDVRGTHVLQEAESTSATNPEQSSTVALATLSTPKRATKCKLMADFETEESRHLSTEQLQRLLIIEQLSLTRVQTAYYEKKLQALP